MPPYGYPHRFVTKNEWNRHARAVRLLLGEYHCDACATANESSVSNPSNPSKGYHRKGLFTQHLLRAHAPWVSGDDSPSLEERASFVQTLKPILERCWTPKRNQQQQSHCPFCTLEFRGASCMDEQMEHAVEHIKRVTQIYVRMSR